MPYIKTFDRDQMMYCSFDSLVEEQSIARIIDAFVDSRDLQEFGIDEAVADGSLAYDPKKLIKLYIYGYCREICSTRELADSCKVNIEVKWLMSGAEPDFRAISNFRKENAEGLKKIFYEFNRYILKAAY